MSRISLITLVALVRAGRRLSRSTTTNLRRAAEHLEVGRWMHAAGYTPLHWARSREQLWELVAAEVGNQKVLYLEFGVYQGAAIRYWSKLLKHPEARLQGFDSFEGLPDHWHAGMPKGFFDVEGKVPVVDDSRVEFFKGWFNETLPGHIFPPHNQLIVNIDSDLYSSSAYVLDDTPLIGTGAFLYFDEFSYVDHELRAFDEFRTRTKMKFSLFCASRQFHAVVFRRVS